VERTHARDAARGKDREALRPRIVGTLEIHDVCAMQTDPSLVRVLAQEVSVIDGQRGAVRRWIDHADAGVRVACLRREVHELEGIEVRQRESLEPDVDRGRHGMAPSLSCRVVQS
jgi:hypothetical protein